jgi:hypothetical protein
MKNKGVKNGPCLRQMGTRKFNCVRLGGVEGWPTLYDVVGSVKGHF